MIPFKKELSYVASAFYDPDTSPGGLFNTCRRYRDLLLKASGENYDESPLDEPIQTTSGKAIASKWASMCVSDIIRTSRFCNGIYKAIQKKQKTKKGKVHILYAGTGPHASLVIPLLERFTPQEITFTLLELNETSYKGLQATIEYFKAQEYISEIKNVDATTYNIPSPGDIDIVITETMMHALKDEPQVAISYTLMMQLNEKVILIPEEIELHLLAVNSEKQFAFKQSLDGISDYYKRLKPIFKLDKNEINKHGDAFLKSFPKYEFSEVSIDIPEDLSDDFDSLQIETSIKIFEDEVIGIDESGLTMLLKLIELNSMIREFSEVRTRYVCGSKPGLKFKFI